MITLLGMAVLWKHQGGIMFGVAMWLLGKVWIVQVRPWLHERRLQRRAEQASLQLRAEHENREWLQAGLYEGHYLAETMPITEPRDWYDYDDGMTEWK